MTKQEIQQLMDEEREKFSKEVEVHNGRMHILETEKEKFPEDRIAQKADVITAMDEAETEVRTGVKAEIEIPQ